MIIRKISHFLCNYENIMPLFAGACTLLFIAGFLFLPIQYTDKPRGAAVYPGNNCRTVHGELSRCRARDLISHTLLALPVQDHPPYGDNDCCPPGGDY